jgi:Zn-dependent peptidase ImmA (M78 family)
MFDYPSKFNIESISMDLLKQSKSIDIFPTPVNKIIRYADLNIDENVDLSKIDNSFLTTLSLDVAKKTIDSMKQVRGALDRNEKTIYLDLSQLPCRQNFVKLHETGHEVLSWQNEILAYIDNDATLDHSTIDEFEAEANYFASTILFQNDRFEKEMSKLKFGIDASMTLAKQFGASNHATIRKYVECSKNRCALLVLEDISTTGIPTCSKRDLFLSESFSNTFGTLILPNKFGYKWDFTRDCYHKMKLHKNGRISLDSENGTADFKYHFFNNSYNAFVLIFPIGDDKI